MRRPIRHIIVIAAVSSTQLGMWTPAGLASEPGVSSAPTTSTAPASVQSGILAVWREEARSAGVGVDDVETYARLIGEGFAHSDPGPRISEESLCGYGDSLRRVLPQYAPHFAVSDRQRRTDILRWLAWCTIEAFRQKPMPPDERANARRAYIGLYGQIIDDVRQQLSRAAGGRLNEEERRTIEEALQSSVRRFERRLDELQSDFLYPAMKVPLTDAQATAVRVVYDNPRLYPSHDGPIRTSMTTDELFVKRVVAELARWEEDVLYVILNRQMEPRLHEAIYWGPTLLTMRGPSGYWPAVVEIRLEPRHGPTTRTATSTRSTRK